MKVIQKILGIIVAATMGLMFRSYRKRFSLIITEQQRLHDEIFTMLVIDNLGKGMWK